MGPSPAEADRTGSQGATPSVLRRVRRRRSGSRARTCARAPRESTRPEGALSPGRQLATTYVCIPISRTPPRDTLDAATGTAVALERARRERLSADARQHVEGARRGMRLERDPLDAWKTWRVPMLLCLSAAPARMRHSALSGQMAD